MSFVKNNSNDQEYFINWVFSFPDPVAADPEFQFKKLSLVLRCTICLHQYLMEKYTHCPTKFTYTSPCRKTTHFWLILK